MPLGNERGTPEQPVVVLEAQMQGKPGFKHRLFAQAARSLQLHPQVLHLAVVVVLPHRRLRLGPRVDSKFVTSFLAGTASMGSGRRNRLLPVLQSDSAATDLDLISYLKAIPDARTRRGVRIPAWYLLLEAVLGILSRCQSLRDLERFALRHHSVLTVVLGLELRRPPPDSAFRFFFRQVDVASLCATIRDWTIAQIPGGATDLDQLICDGKTLRGSIEPTAGCGSAFIAQVMLYSAALGVAISQAC